MAEVLSLISSMESLQTRIASDHFRNILTLLNLAAEEYEIAVKGDVISDMSEYQDSYGFILEAKKQSAALVLFTNKKIHKVFLPFWRAISA